MWYVYIVKCKDGSFYTGITTDIERRILEHNSSLKGAKYTKGRRPVELVYSKKIKNKSAALIEECHIKKMTKEKKISYIQK